MPGPAAPIARPLPRTASHLVPAVLAAALAAATLLRMPAAWESGNSLNHVSGAWMTLADDLAHGAFYRPLHDPALGYGGTRFFPLSFVLHAALLRAGLPLLAAGYLLSVAAGLAAAAGAAVFLRRSGHAPWAAVALAALPLAGFAGQLALGSARGDLLAATLASCALAALLPAPAAGRPGGVTGPALLLALAFLAKPTALAPAAAGVAYLALRGERGRAVRLAGAVLAGCTAGVVLVELLSGGRFLELIAALGAGGGGVAELPRGPARLGALLVREDPAGLALLLAGAAALARRWRREEAARPIAIRRQPWSGGPARVRGGGTVLRLRAASGSAALRMSGPLRPGWGPDVLRQPQDGGRASVQLRWTRASGRRRAPPADGARAKPEQSGAPGGSVSPGPPARKPGAHPPWRSFPPGLLLAGLWLVAALGATLATLASPGTGVNHLLDLEVPAGLLAAAGLASSPGRLVRLGATLAAAAGLATAAGVWHRDLAGSRLEAARTAALAAGEGRAPLLSEDPLVPLVAGERPVLLDAWMLRLASRRSPELSAPLLEALRDGRFRAVVLLHDANGPGADAWFAGDLGPAVLAEVRRHWRASAVAGPYHVYEYAANPPASGPSASPSPGSVNRVRGSCPSR